MTTQNPQITVRQLITSLQQLGPAWDDAEVKVWLPGSYISVAPTLIPHAGKGLGAPPRLLLEGNIDPGSALEVYL